MPLTSLEVDLSILLEPRSNNPVLMALVGDPDAATRTEKEKGTFSGAKQLPVVQAW